MSNRRFKLLFPITLLAVVACNEMPVEAPGAPEPAFTRVAPPPALTPHTVADVLVRSGALSAPAPARNANFGVPMVNVPGRMLPGEIVYIGQGCFADAYLGDPSGKIALIQRGFCRFDEKVTRAEAAGAIGVIVFNNVGDAILTMGGITANAIPAVFIGQTNGLTLAAASPTSGVIEWNPFDPLAGVVSQLQAAGVLNVGQTRSLTQKLANAKAAAGSGDDAGALDLLTSFVDQVNAFVQAKLIAEADGAFLTAVATGIIASLTP